MELKIFNSTDELSLFFAELLLSETKKLEKGKCFSLALSGGNSPKILFKYLADNYAHKIDWSKILFFWGDERCVPPDDEQSNYLLAKNMLFHKISAPEENIFRIKGENDPKAEAERNSKLVVSKLTSVNGLPQFDLVLLGLGEDGHTASIFPDNMKLLKSEKIFDLATHPQTKQLRISLSGRAINNAKTVAFVTFGKKKADILHKIINRKAGYEKLPASSINPENGKLFWLLDNDASMKIK